MTETEEDSESTMQIDEEAPENKIKVAFAVNKSELLNILNLASVLVDSMAITFEKKGMNIMIVDPAHVAMIGMEMPAEYFTGYSCKIPKKCPYTSLRIGVDVTKLKQFVKSLSGNETIQVSVSRTEGMVLVAGRMKRTMHLIDESAFSEPKIPRLNLPATIKIKNGLLKEAMTAVGHVADHLRMQRKEDAFKIIGEGDADSVVVSFTKDETEIESTSEDDEMSLFPHDYMSNFVKAIPAKIDMELKLGSDYPCMFKFELGGFKKKMECTYLLAPRVESE